MEADARVEVIQALIPLALMHVEEELQAEVERLVGPRYGRGEDDAGLVRWGRQRGSVFLQDQKVPVMVPRVRDRREGQEVSLAVYRSLQAPRQMDRTLMLRVLRGLSCRSYEETAAAVPEALGLSPSTVSRRFIKATARKLREMMERDLSGHDFVALVMDGKGFGRDSEMVTALGITLAGKKVVLGFIETATENERVCSEFLRSLVDRGLACEKGLLVVLDGAKGLRKAVKRVFGGCALVQRCQWHKRENVVGYLPKSRRPAMRRQLQRAYKQPLWEDAKAALLGLKKELALQNQSAARSLEEGLEETLTLHRLGLFEELGTSLKTTNTIESLHSLLGSRTDKVDRWRNSNQRQRWVAAALLDMEPGLRRIKGCHHLPALRYAIQADLNLVKQPTLKSA
ncbi:MAG: IS256 family transposase [bacterium]|nr:IS256 family transposase [bacterium]